MSHALYARTTRKTSGRVNSILETKLATFGSNAGLSLGLTWCDPKNPLGSFRDDEEGEMRVFKKKNRNLVLSCFIFPINFQKPGQPIVGIHLTSIISTAWTLAVAIWQNPAGWNPRAYGSWSAQAGRWNRWNETSLGGNPSIHRPEDREFRGHTSKLIQNL